ncbi:MAG: DoxX family protein [Rickettsiales bacterium]
MTKNIFGFLNIFLKTTSASSHLMLFILRLWIAHVFWVSGILKIEDFENTVALFRDEYQVPFLPPVFAAIMGTIFEISCPILLTLGLGTRLATLPLLVMTAVIQFTYDQNIQHAYWAMLLGTILCSGAGKFSADYLIKQRFGSLLENKR